MKVVEEYMQRLKALNLPEGGFVIIGSGPLALRGIRQAADVDVVVSPTILAKLAQDEHWQLAVSSDGRQLYVRDQPAAEAWSDLDGPDGCLSYEQVLAQSEICQGVRCLTLEALRAWKLWRGREKDVQDAALIDTYLEGSKDE